MRDMYIIISYCGNVKDEVGWGVRGVHMHVCVVGKSCINILAL